MNRLFRQLGTWGTTLVVAPFLWLGACVAARALAQSSYDTTLSPWAKTRRVPEGPIPGGGLEVKDPRVLTELGKYLEVWSLEPGACAAFPDGARVPFTWNPFRPSALMLRLKQKQAFLLTQHHTVLRTGTTWYLAPDPQAALGGRRFRLEVAGDRFKAYEL